MACRTPGRTLAQELLHGLQASAAKSSGARGYPMLRPSPARGEAGAAAEGENPAPEKKPLNEDDWRERTNAMNMERTHAFQMAQRPSRRRDPEEKDDEEPSPNVPRFRG